MSNTARIAATAANTLTKPLNVEDVFSTYLYTGTGSTKTITNGIDLSGEGGLVWSKARSQAYPNAFFDTERGALKYLDSGSTSAEITGTNNLTAFNSNGFTLGADSNWAINKSGTDYCTWTFRKAPKFFDVVTYTGDGTSSRAISHSLGSTPGCIIIKRTDASAAWTIFHRGLSGGITGSRILFDTSAATSGSNITAVDNSTFTVISTGTNNSGGTYVAYLFAHNDGDGDFGPTGDQDIIKCGSYTGTGSSGLEVDLGFEPQWVLTKRTDTSGYNWVLQDNMRSMTDVDYAWLYADLSNAEGAGAISGGFAQAQPTGYMINGTNTNVNASGGTYIYIAIRRGPMAVPESATDVFDVEYSNQNGDGYYANLGAVTDTWLYRVKNTTSNWMLRSRLTGANYLHTNLTNAETSQSFSAWDNMNGVGPTGVTAATNTNEYNWVWKRAPNFFDVVAYAGAGAAQTINHNLGVAPEMIWVKVRDFATSWTVFHKDLGIDKWLNLDNTNTVQTASGLWGTSDPDATTFGLGLNTGLNNGSGRNYIAYLFASLDGISKVGSYTGNGSITGPSIDCGFSAGPRFVLIKRTDSAENWYLFDSERGIVAGTDPYLMLNSTSAEINAGDIIDPTSSGFQLATNGSSVNASGGTYIFYAIA
jgi:hypothetical protein